MLAAPLLGAFMQAAAAQGLEHIDFSKGAYPFEDLDIEVFDISHPQAKDRDPYVYHFAGRSCGNGQEYSGPLVTLLAEPAEQIKTYLVDDEGSQLIWEGDPTVADFVFGADGTIYDLRDPVLFRRFMNGQIETGQHIASPEFKTNLYFIMQSCAPQF